MEEEIVTMKYKFIKDWTTGSPMALFKFTKGQVVDGVNISKDGGIPSFKIYENGQPVATISGIGILTQMVGDASSTYQADNNGLVASDVKDEKDKKIEPKENPAPGKSKLPRNILIGFGLLAATLVMLKWKKVI